MTNTYANRLRVGLSLQQPTGLWTNLFGYDDAGRIASVLSPAGTFTYTLGATAPASPLVKNLSLRNTSYITNAYDSVARLLFTKLNKSDHTTLDSALYGYNAGNQRLTFTNAAGTYVSNRYDRIGQLKVVDSSDNSEDRGYAYDAAWNLNYRTNQSGTDAFALNNLNEITSIQEGGSFFSASYEVNGNLSQFYFDSFNGFNFYYDAENRLTEVDDLENNSWAGAVIFQYDGLGRLRIRKTYHYGVSTNEVHYLYDGWRVIQERDANNTPQVSYTRGSDLSGTMEGAGGIGGLLARSHAYQSGSGAFTNHNYYHADGNGNVTYLETSSQGLAASYRYDAYGNLLSASGSLASANVYRFSSKEQVQIDPLGVRQFDSLYYYGYRFYAPHLQRWLNSDPIGELGFEVIEGRKGSILAGGPNRFRFARNSPIDYYDPFGLKSTTLRCKPADEKRIRDSLKAACQKFESKNANQCDCLRKNLPPDPSGGDPAGLALADIRKFCKNKVDNDKVTIQCDYSDSTSECQSPDNGGAYGDHDSTITFCSKYFNGTTAKNGYTDDCVASHEIAHWGFGTSPSEMNGASTYDKCFGCPGRSHTK